MRPGWVRRCNASGRPTTKNTLVVGEDGAPFQQWMISSIKSYFLQFTFCLWQSFWQKRGRIPVCAGFGWERHQKMSNSGISGCHLLSQKQPVQEWQSSSDDCALFFCRWMFSLVQHPFSFLPQHQRCSCPSRLFKEDLSCELVNSIL